MIDVSILITYRYFIKSYHTGSQRTCSLLTFTTATGPSSIEHNNNVKH